MKEAPRWQTSFEGARSSSSTIVPVAFDDITLVELEPCRTFYEVSGMLAMREWRHRRTLTATADGCIVRDEIAFEPRWRWMGPVLAWLDRMAFRLRHRNLRRLLRPARGIPPPLSALA